MAVEAGTRLGRFVVHEYLGQGTLGTVYRAVDPDQEAVAIKVLLGLADPESRERFEELAPRLVGVRHPRLVAVLDHGEHGGVPYLVTQHVDAVTLAERFRRSTMRPASVVALLRGVAAGVDHAHERGLVHGNLEPGQVLLASDDEPLVSDFGLAPLRPPRDGTPEYLAPEQVAGGEPTASSDRYAFATIAYQLLVDRTPFEGEPQSVLDAQLRGEPLPPSSRSRALPAAVDAVLIRGLAKDQAGRWRTCRELVLALDDALGAGPAARREVAGGGARRRLAPYVLAAALAATAGLITGVVAAHRGHDAAPAGGTLPNVRVVGGGPAPPTP